MLEDTGSGFQHVALVDVFDGFRHDGGSDAGNRELADGGIDVALECARRFGVMACAPFPLLHGQPFLGDGFKGVVHAGSGLLPG